MPSDAWRVCLAVERSYCRWTRAIKYELLGIDSVDQLLAKMDTAARKRSVAMGRDAVWKSDFSRVSEPRG